METISTKACMKSFMEVIKVFVEVMVAFMEDNSTEVTIEASVRASTNI